MQQLNEVITPEMTQIKYMIAETVARREALKSEMQEWYERFPNERFAKLTDLIAVDGVLSQLDSHYKRLWDHHNGCIQSA